MTDSANVDIVRSIHADWSRGDFSVIGWAHPEVEFVIADGPSPGRWTRHAEVVSGSRDFLNAWDDFSGEGEEYRALDDKRVLVLVHRSGRGKTSGMDLGQLGSKGASLFEVRDRKVTRIVAYWDRGRALADLGLEA